MEIHNTENHIKYLAMTSSTDLSELSYSVVGAQLINRFGLENLSYTIISEGDFISIKNLYNDQLQRYHIACDPDYYNIPQTDKEKKEFQEMYQYLKQCRLNTGIANRNKETYRSDEYREKCKLNSMGDNNPMYGHKHTEESRKLMSKNRSGLTCGKQNGNYGNRGEKAKNGKPVYQYQDSEHSVLIHKYNTLQLFLETFGLKGHNGLDKAVNTNSLYRGFYWSRNGNV